MQVSSGSVDILLSAVLGFGFLHPFLYSTYFAVHAGIACLAFPTYDWSQLHAGIVCLAYLASDWMIACWDSLSVLLHTGIACLASLAYDWVIACWDSLSILACWDSLSNFLACDWLVNNGCFNPIGVNSLIA